MEELLNIIDELPDKEQVSLADVIEYTVENFRGNSSERELVLSLFQTETVGSFLEEYVSEYTGDYIGSSLDKLLVPIGDYRQSDISYITDYISHVEVMTSRHYQDFDSFIASLYKDAESNDGLGAGTYLLMYNALKRLRGEEVDDFI